MSANNKHMTVDGVIEVLSDMQQKADNRFAKGGGIVFSVDGSNKISAEDSSGNDIGFPGDGTSQIVTAYTLSASGWNNGVYSLESLYPSSTYNVEIAPYTGSTSAQLAAYEKAKMVGAVSGNTITCLGDVPSIDINMMIIATAKTNGTSQTAYSYTMLASSWNGSSYSLESQYPFTSYNIQIRPSASMTSSQLAAFSKAKLVGSISANTVTALGTVPSIDIPVTIIATTK